MKGAIEVSMTSVRKLTVRRGETVKFHLSMDLNGDDLVDDFDGTINRALDRVSEMMQAQVKT